MSERRRMSVADMSGKVRRASKQVLALEVEETRADKFHSKRYHNQADLVCKTPAFRKQCELDQHPPSIRDYYRTVCQVSPSKTRISERPKGMSNYSSIQLGDERMHQEFESVSLAMSRAAVRAREEREAQRRADGAEGASGTAPANVQAPPTGIVRLRRQNEYRTAIESVGLAQVKNLERMMRDKLQQRTKSGPFQLRKNFRYFDVDADGEITLMEFSECMNKMGFAFKEEEIIALFGLYDEDGNGSIDYNEFCDKLMEKEFMDVRNHVRKSVISDQLGSMLNKLSLNTSKIGAKVNKYGKVVADGKGDPALDSSRSNTTEGSGSTEATKDQDDEYNEEEAEVVRIFGLIDRDSSGSIDASEFELLTRALGKNFAKAESIRILTSLDRDGSGTICLREFMRWWRDHNN